MSSPTQHNKSVAPARSRVLDLGYQQPQSGSQHEFTGAVAEVTDIILQALPATGQEKLQAIHPSTNAMISHTPNRLPQAWSQALLVVSCPEYFYADAETIEQVNSQVIRATSRIFRDFGLSSTAMAEGLTQAGRELATSSTR